MKSNFQKLSTQPPVVAIQVIYNNKEFIERVFTALKQQDYPNFETVAVIAASDDGSKELLIEHFPEVTVIDPGYNIGFAKGHNEYFAQSNAELFQLVNPDLILKPDYISRMVQAFVANPKLGAATGKLLQYDFKNNQPTGKIDTTGVIYFRSGLARDRGQHEVDAGQYDKKIELIGVSGAGCMYRKSALETIKSTRSDGSNDYFDTDFHSYYEDVDLSLQLITKGWQIEFIPKAVGFHGRTAGSSPGGIKKFFTFVKNYRAVSERVRRLSWRNNIFLFIKNMPQWYGAFFARQIGALAFITVFNPAVLKEIPHFLKLLPVMLRKRKQMKANRQRAARSIKALLSS